MALCDDDNPYMSYGEAIEVHDGSVLVTSRLQTNTWVTKEVAAAKPLTWDVCTEAQRREYVTTLITDATSLATRTPSSTSDALEQLFSLTITKTASTTKLLLEPATFASLLTGLTSAVTSHRSIWPAPTTTAGLPVTADSKSSASSSSPTVTSLSQLAASSPANGYVSLRIIRYYLNIIYTTISTRTPDTGMIATLVAAQCGTLPLITFLFELLPSSNSIISEETKAATPATTSLDLNTILPWKKVILLIRQLVLILIVPPVVSHPTRTGNTPGTSVDGTRAPTSTAATPAATATAKTAGTKAATTPNIVSMPVQYGVKSRLNDLRDACADATLRFSPVAFFPGDRFTPPDFTAMSDLPTDVRERLEYLKANLYPRHSSYSKAPRRCPPLPLRKPTPGAGEISAVAAAINKKSQKAGSGHRPSALFDINSESICEPTTAPSMSPFDDPDFWNDPTVGKTNGGTSSASSSTAAGTRFSFDRTPPSRTRGLSSANGGSAPSSAEKKIEEKTPEWCAPVQPIATQVYRQLLAGRGIQTYITGLLKVLLTAGARNDLHNDRLALDLRHELIIPAHIPLCDKLAAIELPRHRQIIIDAIAFTLLTLLKSYRANDVIQFNFLRSVLNHRNAGVVILKALSHPLSKPYTAAHDIFSISHTAAAATTSDTIVAAILASSKSSPEKKGAKPASDVAARTIGNGDVPVNGTFNRPIHSYINLMRILQKLTKRSPAHIQMMHHIKVPALLTKILAPSSPPLLRFYALKLAKSLVRYQSAQWRTDNSGIITEIYSTLRLDVCDDWLKSGHETKAHYDELVKILQTQRAEYEAYNAALITAAADAAAMASSLDKAAKAAALIAATVSDDQLRREYDEWIHQVDQDLLDDAIDELQNDSPPPSPKGKTVPGTVTTMPTAATTGVGAATSTKVQKSVTIAEPEPLHVV